MVKLISELVLQHKLDDIQVKIIKLSEESFLWIQYSVSKDVSELISTKIYPRDKIVDMISFFRPLGSIEPIELFNKFDKL